MIKPKPDFQFHEAMYPAGKVIMLEIHPPRATPLAFKGMRYICIKAKQTAIEAQKKECRRWENLHELIGSADGKKYRNFAQGLTFEMMIGHANRQLQKMTDRYLLVRDGTQPLELNVFDNYQAGVKLEAGVRYLGLDAVVMDPFSPIRLLVEVVMIKAA